jgi:alpha-glucosidase
MPQYFGKLPVAKQTWSVPGIVQAIETSDRHLVCTCEHAQLTLSILSNRLIRVQLIPANQTLPHRSWAVTQPDNCWAATPFSLQETDSTIQVQTDLIRIEIDRGSSQVTAYDSTNQVFAQDADFGMAWQQDWVTVWKRIESEEHFYGLGERTGLLDQRSQIRTHWTTDALDYNAATDEMYQAIPFLMALRPGLAYGIFLNSTCWSQFDLGVGQPGVWQMTARTTALDYYLIYGPTPAEILATYTQLTGRMPLPPKWALGYQQCRWSYESEAIVRELAGEFRDRRLPCDVIYLDIDYMQGYRVFSWSPQRFPDPTGLLQELKNAGFKVVTIVDPGVKYEPDGDYSLFQEGMELDYFVRTREGQLFHGYVWPDKAVFPDFMRAEVRQWWGDWQKTLTETGVAGIWNDMNEPALDDRPFGENGEKII